MSSIDERIVNMRFNGQQFQAGIKGAQIALGMLKKNMNLDSATKSLDGLDAAGKRFSLAGLTKGVEAIGSKFSAMSIIGITALTNIANKAINVGSQILKSLTIDPVMDGFNEYELKMGSIQTILANTSRHGTGLAEVTSNLEELNLYADKTIYNFGDMTRNIGLFTNAGIKIGDATSMIKGFSNEAAASGTSAEGASGAAYQLSQALSAGTIRLMDWKSLSNVGMGNKNMQNGLIELASAMGTFEGKSITAEEAASDFNGSLEKEWLSADVMQNYLQIQAGDLSDAQMKTIGLTGEQITAFKKQQTIAQDAATKVRTWTQLLGTLQEGVGSGWGQTFETLIGDFDQATELWTNVNNALGPMISASGDARNKLLDSWAKLGGRENLIAGLSKAFHVLLTIMKPITDAFKEIFPPMTGKQLFAITSALNTLMENLYVSESMLANLKSTFKGLFAVVDIGWMIIKGLVRVIFDLIGSLGGAGGGVLAFTGGIGNFLVAVRDALKNGEGLNKFFSGLTAVLKVPLGIIGFLVSGFMSLASSMTGLDKGAPGAAVENLKKRLDPLKNLGQALSDIWGGFVKVVQRVVGFFAPLGGLISGVVNQVTDAISAAMDGMDFNGVLDLLNVGLLGGIIFGIKKFIDVIKGAGGDLGGGFLSSITGTFDGLTDTLGAMQAQLKSKALMNIAIAVALLTVSVVALSMIDSAKLTAALVAMTVMFTQLAVSMGIFTKMASGPGIVQIPILAAGLILLSVAILLLTASVAILAALDWNQLAKGLTGVTVLIGALVAAAKGLQGLGPGMIASGAGLMLLAIAIRILAGAVTKLSGLSWEAMTQGLVGVSGLLLALVGFSRLVGNPAGIIKTSIAMLVLGAALHVLAGGIEKFGNMSWDVMIRGLVGAAGALVGIGAALSLIPKGAILSAAAVIVVAKALEIIQPVMAKFGAMDWVSIAKAGVMLAGTLLIIAGAMALMTSAVVGSVALIVVAKALEMIQPVMASFGAMDWISIAKAGVMLAGTLLIIAGGMAIMTTALPGAAALIIVAAAMSLLGPVLLAFGNMSWDQIVHGLAMLAGVFLVIGVAGLVLTPLVPTLLGLGIAILLIGAGAALAGVGILALSVGLTALAVAGTAGAAALVAIVTGIIGLIPMALKALGEGIILLAGIIGEGAPAIVGALVALVMSLLQALITLTPLIMEAFVTLVGGFLQAIIEIAPQLGEALIVLINQLISVITTLIPGVVEVFVLMISSIITGLQVLIPQIIQLLTDVASKFLQSIVTLTPQIVAVFVTLISSLLQAIITLTPQIIQVFVTLIRSLLQAVQTLIPEFAKTVTVFVMTILNTINFLAPQIVQTLLNLLHLLVETVVREVPYMVDAGMRLILGIIRGISNKLPEVLDAGGDLIVKFVEGIGRNLSKVADAAFDTVMKFIEELSTTINNNTERMRSAGGDLAWALINGMTGGLLDGARDVAAKAWELGAKAIASIKGAIDSNSPSKKSRELGRYTADGLAVGITDGTKKVARSATNIAVSALSALKTGMSKVADAVNMDIDMSPVIRPVLDLTDIQKNASRVGSLLDVPSLSLDGSFNSAARISNSSRAVQDSTATTQLQTAPVGDSITFIQNNNSPKALSAATLYRQTKNQLSVVKDKVTP